MKIILHLGAHCTDGDQILRCLRRNEGKLFEQGIVIPEPSRYRPVIREALQTLRDAPVSKEAQELVLDAILNEDEPERVVLSHDGFLGVTERAVGSNLLYPMTAGKAPRLRQLFGNCELEFHLGIRNPATFVPEVFARTESSDLEGFLNGSDPMQLRWSNLVARLRKNAPDARVTVWCNEDTPMIWNELLQIISNHDEHTELDGINDFVGSLITRPGHRRMNRYLQAHPPKNAAQRQRVLAAFLEKFALDNMLDQEIDLPGWTEGYVASLTELYDEDCDLLGQMEGVRFITT